VAKSPGFMNERKGIGGGGCYNMDNPGTFSGLVMLWYTIRKRKCEDDVRRRCLLCLDV
jgi:hypothetical protein